MARDGEGCFAKELWRQERCGKRGVELHHIIPRSRPFMELWSEKNLCLLCTYCHARIGQSREFRTRAINKLYVLYGYKYDYPPWSEYWDKEKYGKVTAQVAK